MGLGKKAILGLIGRKNYGLRRGIYGVFTVYEGCIYVIWGLKSLIFQYLRFIRIKKNEEVYLYLIQS